ncbi:MAG: hypothetical protein AAB215_03135 [Planctomycetota bacterium]
MKRLLLLLPLLLLPACAAHYFATAETEYARGIDLKTRGRYGEAFLAFGRADEFAQCAGDDPALAVRLNLLRGLSLLERARVGDRPEPERRRFLEKARGLFAAAMKHAPGLPPPPPEASAYAILALADIRLLDVRTAKAALENALETALKPAETPPETPAGHEKKPDARRPQHNAYEDGIRRLADALGSCESALQYARDAKAKSPEVLQAAWERRASGFQLAAEFFRRAAGLFENDPPARDDSLALAEGYQRSLREAVHEGLREFPHSAALHFFAAIAEAGLGDFSGAQAHLREARALGFLSASLVRDADALGDLLEGTPDRRGALASQILVDDFESAAEWKTPGGTAPPTADGWLRIEIPKGRAGSIVRPLGPSADPRDLCALVASIRDFPAEVRIRLSDAGASATLLSNRAAGPETAKRSTFRTAFLPKELPGKSGSRTLRIEWDAPPDKAVLQIDILYFAGPEALPW